MIANILPGRRLDQAVKWAASQPEGAGFGVLLHAAAARQIALVAITHRRDVWIPRDLKSSLPTVVLIGDDGGDSRNPDEWRCAISAVAWARSAIIHGTGAEVWHYAEAVRAAQLTGRCLFIETDSAHAPAWTAAVAPRGIPGLTLIPPGGQRHPVVAAVTP